MRRNGGRVLSRHGAELIVLGQQGTVCEENRPRRPTRCIYRDLAGEWATTTPGTTSDAGDCERSAKAVHGIAIKHAKMIKLCRFIEKTFKALYEVEPESSAPDCFSMWGDLSSSV